MRHLASLDDQTILRRKVALAGAGAEAQATGVDRHWRTVMARAARDAMSLGLEVTRLEQSRASLTELLDMPIAHSLIAVLDGPQGGLGLMVISPPLLAAMTEIQTIGRVAALMPAPRKPTRTDAAMVAEFIDTALAGLAVALADEADLIWAGGFRYASFLDDPRPLGLLLEDIAYRVQAADVTLENGVRVGHLLLALPANGRGERPRSAVLTAPAAVAERAFANDLADQINASNCVLHAILCKMAHPLSGVMSLQVGDVLPMALASVDRIVFEGLNGQHVAEGRLGQNRGMRAVRLSPPVQMTVPDQKTQGDIIDLQQAAVG